MDLLRPEIQPYAWGSHTAIAELTGRPAPTERPEAELWMGAHPSAPSGLDRDGAATTLDRVIAKDPGTELGEQVARQFGGRLPFLLKVLAAEKALSIQVHPSRSQAEAGYRAQTGVPPARRNYVDDWPKPELLCALTRFEALAGFRPPGDAAALLSVLAVDRLDPVAAMLLDDRSADALATILQWPQDDRQTLIAEVAERLAVISRGGPYSATATALTRVSSDHPGDIGLVAALLLNYRVLEPGEAVFMPAGGLHAYLRGTGIELLANSDNVLRAGLTGKHIDVPELLKITDPSADVPLVTGRAVADGVRKYDTPAPEFTLYTAQPTDAGEVLPGEGPRVVMCINGSVVLRARGETVKVARGESVFVPASDGKVATAGHGKVFVAAPGELPY